MARQVRVMRVHEGRCRVHRVALARRVLMELCQFAPAFRGCQHGMQTAR
jgi:hypothetical protein